MSAINGDKARFHKARKKQIQRRLSKQAMLKTLAASAPLSKKLPKQEPA
jgi:hypothetical protein